MELKDLTGDISPQYLKLIFSSYVLSEFWGSLLGSNLACKIQDFKNLISSNIF